MTHTHIIIVQRLWDDHEVTNRCLDSLLDRRHPWGMKRAVIYARVSSDLQKKEGTIESQILELRKHVTAAGDVLVKEYIDDGYEGVRLDRPALIEFRADLRPLGLLNCPM